MSLFFTCIADSCLFAFGCSLLILPKNRYYFLFSGVQGFYEYIKGASILEFLKGFLSHEDPNVRAKACSAVGNMCRHSAYFYSSLVSMINNSIGYEVLINTKKSSKKKKCSTCFVWSSQSSELVFMVLH